MLVQSRVPNALLLISEGSASRISVSRLRCISASSSVMSPNRVPQMDDVRVIAWGGEYSAAAVFPAFHLCDPRRFTFITLLTLRRLSLREGMANRFKRNRWWSGGGGGCFLSTPPIYIPPFFFLIREIHHIHHCRVKPIRINRLMGNVYPPPVTHSSTTPPHS
jgi:hypothetical protein